MMGWYQDDMGGGGWLIMLLVMLTFWGLVVWGVVALFRDTRSDNTRPAHRDPLDILGERYARGEIDETEYRARADVLRAAHR